MEVMRNSCDNDRSLFIEGNVEGYEGCYDVASIIKKIQERGDTVIDSYEGVIY